MIQRFADKATEDMFRGRHTRAARRLCPSEIWKVARRKLTQLDSVESKDEMKIPPGNQFEELKGQRQGEYSVPINRQYRVTFRWAESGPTHMAIEKHYE